MQSLQLQNVTGDIFAIGPNNMIIHACNTKGLWGSGIARSIKHRYPRQYQVYREYCQSHSPDELVGTSLLIGPSHRNTVDRQDTHEIWIGCLFTNKDIGRDRHTQQHLQVSILQNTKIAMANLLEHVNNARTAGRVISDLHMPQINAGAFQIPWSRTLEALNEVSFLGSSAQQSYKVYVHTLNE